MHDLVPVNDRIDIAQRRMEERFQIVVISAGGDGVDDLIEIEIGENQRRFAGLAIGRRLRSRKEDAAKSAMRAGTQFRNSCRCHRYSRPLTGPRPLVGA